MTQHIVTGAGAPSAAPPSIGAHYVDTSAKRQYLAVGTASAADWLIQPMAITSTSIDGSGHLIVTYSDTSTADLGLVKGVDGAPGDPGDPGLGITSMVIDENKHLIVTYTDATTADLGVVVGADGADGAGGAPGDPGDPGAAGLGIQSALIDETGHLILTFTDATTTDAGSVVLEGSPDALLAQQAIPTTPIKVVAITRVNRGYLASTPFVVPPETQQGDDLILIVGTTSGSTLVAPPGWAEQTRGQAINEERAVVFYHKTANGTDPGKTYFLSNVEEPNMQVMMLVIRNGTLWDYSATVLDGTGAYDSLPIAPLTSAYENMLTIAVVSSMQTDYPDSDLLIGAFPPEGWGRLWPIDYQYPDDGDESQPHTFFAAKVCALDEVATGNFTIPDGAGASTDNDVVSLTINFRP